MVRRGRINIDQVTKQVKTFLPEFMREEWLRGIAACKDHGKFVFDFVVIFRWIIMSNVFIINRR